MARKGIPGLSFSWKRALGVTAAKQRIARMTGIPTTRQGRQAKLGRSAIGLIGALLASGASFFRSDNSGNSGNSGRSYTSKQAQSNDMRARREYIALKNISEGNPANFSDITNRNYVQMPPLCADIHAAPTEYKPKLTELGKAALKNYIQQFRQDK